MTGSVDVRDYGAVLDGVTNDTAAWLAAVSAAAGRPIYVPSGTLLIDPDAFTSSLRVFGDFRGASVIKWRGGQEALAFLWFHTNPLSVELRDLTINSNRQGHTEDGTERAGVRVTAPASEVICENVRFLNGRAHDILIAGQQVHGTRSKLRLRGCGFFEGLESTETAVADFVRIQDDVDVQIVGCEGEGPTTNGIGRAGFVMQQGDFATHAQVGSFLATGNILRNVGRNTIHTYGAIDVYSGADTVAITGNVIAGCFGRGICVKADASAVTISGNAISDLIGQYATAAITRFNSPLPHAGKSLGITGNVIRNSAKHGIVVDGASMGSEIFENANIADNVLSGVTDRNIHVRNIGNVKIAGNVMAGGVYGIVPAGGVVGGCVVAGNLIKDVSDDGIAIGILQPDLDLDIHANVIDGPSDRGITIEKLIRTANIHANTIRGAGGIGVALATTPSEAWHVHGNVTTGASTPASLPSAGGQEWGNSWN